jgi:hypothetical protein
VRHLAAVAAACMLVAACAGTVKEGMTRLEGQPLSAVIAKLGQPIDERMDGGNKVYIWGSPEIVTKGAKDKQCQIRAIMNGDLVGSFYYEGDEALCQRYAARLRP